MLTELANNIITDGVNTLIGQVQAAQSAKGLRASGASAKSLHQTQDVGAGQTTTHIRGSYTFRYQENGRGPNRSGRPSKEQLDGLREWIAIRGIEPSALWPIAVKIAREGITVPNRHNPGGVLSEVLSTENVKAVIGDRLRAGLKAELMSNLFGIV